MSKRILDVAGSLLGLLVCLPIMLFIALAVRVTSRGPIIFRQWRVGQYGKSFVIHKFRTMYVNDEGQSLSASGDSRVTRIGVWLRRSKLDELPQLFDVLRGDMSLVGPRPELRRFVDLWPSEARAEILALRPGITDPASILFRNEADLLGRVADPDRYYVEVLLPRKVEAYLRYGRTRTFSGDVRILWETVQEVVTG